MIVDEKTDTPAPNPMGGMGGMGGGMGGMYWSDPLFFYLINKYICLCVDFK
jgi:hypothetical protein